MQGWQEIPPRAASLLQQGKADEAQRLCERTLETHPDAHPVACVLGQILLQRGKPKPALDWLDRAVKGDPASAPYRVALGRGLAASGDVIGSVQQFREAERLAPGHAHVLAGLGEALLALGDRESAREKLMLAVRELPPQAETVRQFTEFSKRLAEWDVTLAAAERWRDLAPSDVRAWLAIGEARGRRHELKAAMEAFDRAIALGAPAALYHATIAELAEHAHELNVAAERATRAIALDPNLDEAAVVLARVTRRQGDAAKSREILQTTIARARSRGQMVAPAHVGLGQTLDALGEYGDAFAEMTKGQEAWSRTPAAQAVDKGFFPKVIREYRALVMTDASKAWPKERPQGSRPAPVFFIGFPRSGTTLTEQILGAHPGLMATDERPLVRAMADRLRSVRPRLTDQGEAIRQMNEDDRALLEATYWNAVGRYFSPAELGSRRVLDKLPMNTVWVPLIRRVFPDAKILFALRDPRDVVLSCFFQEFALNEANVHFTQLRSSAELYAQVMGLWLACRDRLELDWLATRYESLVLDVEGAARQMLQWLGEPWDERVLAFQSVQRLSRTASYAQVTKPVSTSAVARWKRYERELEPVLPILAPFVKAFGYADDSHA